VSQSPGMVIKIDKSGITLYELDQDGIAQYDGFRFSQDNDHIIANMPLHRLPTVSRLQY
jgi:hypothetical protein